MLTYTGPQPLCATSRPTVAYSWMLELSLRGDMESWVAPWHDRCQSGPDFWKNDGPDLLIGRKLTGMHCSINVD